MDINKTQFIKDIFRGRDDAYGLENVGCVKELIIDDVVWSHLTGEARMGVYPLMHNNVWFTVIDIDENDLDKAKLVQMKFAEYGIKAYMERSKLKGYHLWMRFAEPVEASKTRAMVKAILTEMGAGFEKIEIFPKQDGITKENSYGNYINLPLFGIEGENDGRTMFLNPDDDYKPYADQWNFLSNIERMTPQKLDETLEALQTEEEITIPTGVDNGNSGTKSGLDNVLNCEFIQYGRNHANSLAEPMWYAMISNLGRFEGGRDIIHEYSKPYPEYSEADTDKKIEHALKDSGPHTCEWIRENGFECPKYGQCHVKSPAGLAFAEPEAKKIILSEIQNPENEGVRVVTEIMIAGTVATTYGVPKDITVTYRTSNGNRSEDITIKRNDRILLDCYKQSDAQLSAILRRKFADELADSAFVEIKSRYTLFEILAIAKSDNNGLNGKHDYRDNIVYYISDGDDNSNIRSNIYYRATGIILSEPKRQAKTMLITELEQLDSPWQAFKLTPEIEGQFNSFKPEDNSVDAIKRKLQEITGDITRNITRRYGTHRERMLLINLLTLSSPISCCFNGEAKHGYLEILIIGDTAQAKTTLLQNLLKAINLGQLVGGSSASRTGLIYSLDTKVNDRRILVWGAFARNDGGFIAVDEAHKLQENEWSELTEVRSNGQIDVNRSVSGRHSARVRQVYLANPPADKPMSHFYCGIEAIKDMMRAEDVRRFDIVMIVAKSDNEDQSFMAWNSNSNQQTFTPEILRNHVCWSWQLSGENTRWTPEAEIKVEQVSRELYKIYGGSVDIPLVVNDVRDKVCKWSQALAALLHSTTDNPNQLLVTEDHIQVAKEEIFNAIYNHENCRLDKYAKDTEKETVLSDEDYIAILEDINNLMKAELNDSTTKGLLDSFTRANSVSLTELAETLNLGKTAVCKRTSILKKHGLIRSSKSGYYRTPKFVTLLKRLESDNETLTEN